MFQKAPLSHNTKISLKEKKEIVTYVGSPAFIPLFPYGCWVCFLPSCFSPSGWIPAVVVCRGFGEPGILWGFLSPCVSPHVLLEAEGALGQSLSAQLIGNTGAIIPCSHITELRSHSLIWLLSSPQMCQLITAHFLTDLLGRSLQYSTSAVRWKAVAQSWPTRVTCRYLGFSTS